MPFGNIRILAMHKQIRHMIYFTIDFCMTDCRANFSKLGQQWLQALIEASAHAKTSIFLSGMTNNITVIAPRPNKHAMTYRNSTSGKIPFFVLMKHGSGTSCFHHLDINAISITLPGDVNSCCTS